MTQKKVKSKLKIEPSIIRWAGSKRKLLPKLVNFSPKQYNRYIEPFCGSASLFFQLSPKVALLSDINFDLINALNQIKSDSTIRDKLTSIPHTKQQYYDIRNQNTDEMTNQERAVRFLYLNRYCFNGVYRTNQSGKFNVPMGTRTGTFPEQKYFNKVRKKLNCANIICSDYRETFKKVKAHDFIYIDPPYAKSDKFTGEYGPGSFNFLEFPKLMAELERIDKIGAKFMLSYRSCNEVIKDINSKFNILAFSVSRHVAGFKDSWQKAKEVIIRNYE